MQRESVIKNLTVASKGLALAGTVYGTAKSSVEWWISHRAYTITVRSDDQMYPDVHEWLLTLLPGERKHALQAQSRTVSRDEGSLAYDDEPGAKAKLRFILDDARKQFVNIDGHTVRVSSSKGGAADKPEMNRRKAGDDSIQFTAATQAGQDAVRNHLAQIVESRTGARRPKLYYVDKWDSWSCRSDIPLRPLDSVVLKPGQKEQIVEDLDMFLAAEKQYVRRGMPWHRGYLFDGPPGTGKTSLAKALAEHFRLDMYYLSLGDLSKDANLLGLLGEIRPRSVLLLEDIDVFHAAQKRGYYAESDSGNVSLAGLLNSLDGATTPHGLVSILTTNSAESLDPALLRAGRIDRNERIGKPDAAQAAELFTVFYGMAPSRPIVVRGRTTSDLTEVFKRNMDDPAAAEAALSKRR